MQQSESKLHPTRSLDSAEIALISTIEVRMEGADGCILCGLCTEICPWNAPVVEGRELIIRQDRCRGCGVCVAACPKRAIDMKVYGTDALLDLIGHVLKNDEEGNSYPDSVFGVLEKVEEALMNLERLIIHGPVINDMDDILHKLKLMFDRISRTQTRIKKEVEQAII